ncbi:Cyclic pyranopterin monophosphate synthase [invertebrate metagenome]|uniref:cyclic pyranopterin monophosphate synthase n=1 Tax=invertebrate metagenome TaxID=1711999 RepID=A0A2H9TCB1_9ZZZZ
MRAYPERNLLSKKEMSLLTHTDAGGQASMVDVGNKAVTRREAVAEGYVVMKPETLRLVQENALKKGDVLSVARIAGIQGAKQCSQLIPLCHPLMLSYVSVDFTIDKKSSRIHIQTACRLNHQTGVEMEALTAVSVAALTIYDMCKAVDRGMRIEGIHLLEKSGGKSGHFMAGQHITEELARKD